MQNYCISTGDTTVLHSAGDLCCICLSSPGVPTWHLANNSDTPEVIGLVSPHSYVAEMLLWNTINL